MTRKRMEALRYSAADIDAVTELVALHLRFHTYKMGWSDSAVRRYVRDAGDLLAELNVLTRCDCTTRDPAQGGRRCRGGWTSSRCASPSWRRPRSWRRIRPELDGTDVMEILGIPPGPHRRPGAAFLLDIRLDEGLIGRDAATARRVASSWYAAAVDG